MFRDIRQASTLGHDGDVADTGADCPQRADCVEKVGVNRAEF